MEQNEDLCENNTKLIKTENCIEIEVPYLFFQCLGSNQSLDKFCRICLSYNESMVSLFSTREDQTCLADLLKAFTSIQVFPGSAMPNQICVTCQAVLLESYNFKIKCEKTECALQSILKGQYAPFNTNKNIGELENCSVADSDVISNITETKEEINEHEDVQYLDMNELESDNEALCIVQELENKNGEEEKIGLTDSKSDFKENCSKNTCSGDRKNRQSVYTCNMCLEKFNKVKHYKVHIKNKHSSEKVSHPCLDCKEIFSSPHDLQLHLAVHMAGPTWKCKKCSKEFKTRAILKRHLLRHMETKRFKCSFCDKSFTEFYALRRHSRVHTGEIVEKKHVCNICNKKYSENSLLVAHMARHNSVRPFVCATCGKTFVTSRLLNSHRKIHSDYKQYACEFCEKRFRHDSTRNTHQRTHTGEKPYVCSICGKTFIQNSNLRLHMRTHTGEKPYRCDNCGKMFTSGSALKIHMRTHTGEKPYSCKICGKRFARMDLSAHMRQHTGERPHACSVCPKKFVNATRLREHYRIHTGEKPYECASCTQTFPTKSHLVKHAKKHQLKKKQEKNRYYVVPHIEPVQYIITNEKPFNHTNKQDVEKGGIDDNAKKNAKLQVAHDMPIEVTDKLVLQDDSEVVVVGQGHNGNIYLSTGVNECTSFTNDVSLVAVNGGEVNISATSAVLEGSTVKLYQLDQSLVQIHRSGGQVTISKITSKMTANF